MHRYFEINGAGHNVRCKLYHGDLKKIQNIVIFAHGFGGHKDNGAAELFAQRLTAKYPTWAMITFNWPTHGDDVKKVLRLSDCEAYYSLVIDYAREKFQPRGLYSYATSFGGYMTLRYVHRNGSPFRKIALRCPAINMYEALTRTIMDSDSLALLEKGKTVPVGFDRKVPVSPDLLEELKEQDIQSWDFLDYAEDTLILHGTKDEVIPFEVSRAFADNQLMEFIPVEGADHRFRNPKAMEQAMKEILAWFVSGD